MDCKKCIYCVQDMRHTIKIICRNKTFLQKLGLFNVYEKIDEPCYCVFYKTKKQQIKEEKRKLKDKYMENKKKWKTKNY